jgi:hypothetical protein
MILLLLVSLINVYFNHVEKKEESTKEKKMFEGTE